MGFHPKFTPHDFLIFLMFFSKPQLIEANVKDAKAAEEAAKIVRDSKIKETTKNGKEKTDGLTARGYGIFPP